MKRNNKKDGRRPRRTVVGAVIDAIRWMPGRKTISLHLPKSQDSDVTFDVDENGSFGELPLFGARLAAAIRRGGGLVVRQFPPTREGEGLPRKVVYGCVFDKGKVMVARPETMKRNLPHGSLTSFGDLGRFLP